KGGVEGLLFLDHREHNNRRGALFRLQPVDDFKAAATGQVQVEHGDIRFLAENHGNRFIRCAGLTDDVKVRSALDRLTQALTKQGMVVYDDNTCFLGKRHESE